jgi:hypothetical protein
VDGDQICDTPVKSVAGPNGATTCDDLINTCMTDEDDPSPNNPYRAISLGGLGEQPDMLENYMGYVSCWDSFTQGQKGRMRAFIEQFRSRMIENLAACSNNPQTILVSQCYQIEAAANNRAAITQINFVHIPVILTPQSGDIDPP